MHEVSLALALIDLVRQRAAAAGASRVVRIVVEIGALSHVEPHALRFAVEAATSGSPEADATLEILRPAGMAYCLDCEASVTLVARGASCSRCGGTKLLARCGDEMRLKEIEVV